MERRSSEHLYGIKINDFGQRYDVIIHSHNSQTLPLCVKVEDKIFKEGASNMNFEQLQNKHIQLINETKNVELPMEGCSSSDRCTIDMSSCSSVDECTVDYCC
jgi:hypothetical protein